MRNQESAGYADPKSGEVLSVALAVLMAADSKERAETPGSLGCRNNRLVRCKQCRVLSLT